jgi:type I restriction enzyme S subunit
MSHFVLKQLKSIMGLQAVPIVNKNAFENVEITLPILKKEQTKISKILSKQDEAIEQEEQKLKKLQSIKKALMQDLLTGKVRVNYE